MSIVFYVIAAVAGFVLQTVLHSPFRMVFYLGAGFVAGFLFSYSYIPLAACIGAGLRMYIGRYYNCMAMMIVTIALGFVAGQFFML